MPIADAKLEALIQDLPDERAARLFLQRLEQEQPRSIRKLTDDPGLLSDALALAAWSPLLATTLEQNPEYVTWLARERTDSRVRTRDELKESLARFSLTHSSVTPQSLFARFRRRELLRIYLHDIRRTHTLVETTEELSNLADAILDYALTLARQELDNRYGPALSEAGGRTTPAEFCVMALGKLGSCELNYSSDIDLVFIYSDDGHTSGSGDRGKVTNREYFVKLAENVAKLVGQPAGESAAYRVDLRLRPHGRDGTLASSLDEAIRYYSKNAQPWELQTLIRSRASAGSTSLFNEFALAVEDRIYRPDVSVKDALEAVRLAKQKIDRRIESRNDGFNVKLQRGGIREIEFIAQALQLAHGGLDEWLRAPHTLISLGRLSDRGLITEEERSQLSDAFFFLRTLEHRLQMEHGLQTHTVPQATEQRALVARRMSFASELDLESFDQALTKHTANVRRAYDRVFAGIDIATPESIERRTAAFMSDAGREDSRLLKNAAAVFLTHRIEPNTTTAELDSLAEVLTRTTRRTTNPHRASLLTARIAASLDKSNLKLELRERSVQALVLLCGQSEFFGEMIAGNPALIDSLAVVRHHRKDYRTQLREAIDAESTFSSELAAFRRAWSRLVLDIGARDAAGKITLSESNSLQTELAVSAINVSYLIARRELVRRYGRMTGGPRLSVLALGRLASGGVDYGSDLDVILIYDSLVSSPVAGLTQDEAYARIAELMIAALSSVTRDGYLYRVDLRLRPNGKNGPLVVSSESFLDYLRSRSAIWEWLAYVKLRAVAGDLEFGKMVETHARHVIHENARQTDAGAVKAETRRVREALEREKVKQRRHGRRRADLDVKYGAGGMLDVYFGVRCLQLSDDVRDEGDDRSTQSTLERLESNGSLSAGDYESLSSGYALLRAIDHQLRIIGGKMSALPSTDHPIFKETATKLGFNSATELGATLREHMGLIREAYTRLTSS